MTNPFLMSAWMLEEGGGWDWLRFRGSKIHHSSPLRRPIIPVTPGNTEQDKEECCCHGESHMHFLSHASKCFIHNQMHHADWWPKSSEIHETELPVTSSALHKVGKYVLSRYSIKDNISIAIPTHNPSLSYP